MDLAYYWPSEGGRDIAREYLTVEGVNKGVSSPVESGRRELTRSY